MLVLRCHLQSIRDFHFTVLICFQNVPENSIGYPQFQMPAAGWLNDLQQWLPVSNRLPQKLVLLVVLKRHAVTLGSDGKRLQLPSDDCELFLQALQVPLQLDIPSSQLLRGHGLVARVRVQPGGSYACQLCLRSFVLTADRLLAKLKARAGCPQQDFSTLYRRFIFNQLLDDNCIRRSKHDVLLHWLKLALNRKRKIGFESAHQRSQ